MHKLPQFNLPNYFASQAKKKATPKRDDKRIKSLIVFNFPSVKRILGRRYNQATTIGKDSKEINIIPFIALVAY
jgi:hypothetical protein